VALDLKIRMVRLKDRVEIKKTLTPSFISDLGPGKYAIEYKYKSMGDIGFGSIKIDISPRDIEMDGNMSIQNFINPDVPEGKVVSIRDIKKIG
jgi:hypothetical protein